MIYMDLEKIYKDRDIANKYVLTLVVSARARQLSERKGVVSGYDEKFITMAVNDVTEGRINFSLVNTIAEKKTDEPLES